MASYDIVGNISIIASSILIVWKAKMVFSLVNWFTQPNFPRTLYQTKYIDPNFYLWDKTKLKSTKQNVLNVNPQIYTEQKIPKHIFSIKLTKLQDLVFSVKLQFKC